MCGIAGLILSSAAPPPDAAMLSRMIRALAHRGPDGNGHIVIGRAALAQSRLAIIDLETGDQPLFSGPATLVANGEIYNYRELRAELGEEHFSTHSDCEPALVLWRQEGPAYAERLRGMFAIAIHERGARSVTLTRDPFGIKPLYTTQTADGLAFASEPRALLDSGVVPRRLRTAARDELLQMQFTTGSETIFEGISRVLPGETLTCTEGHIIDRQRQPALPEGGHEEIDEDSALERLDRALEESVLLHQRSDVPYGMFLSGGVDSSAVLAMMGRLNNQPVLAYTAGWDVEGAEDERAHAAVVAKAAGAQYEPIEITEAMVWEHLPEIVACMDDPAADYAIIPTWFLARRARQDVKVVLSGEGGDELFGGYGRYRRAMRPWWLGGRVMRGCGNFDRLNVLRRRPTGWRDGFAASEQDAVNGERSRLAAAQAADVADWLPHDLLLKLDRCLMAHGVEGRTPFLDRGVAAAVFRLPDHLKLQGRIGKWVLRRWLERHLPQAAPFAPKRGFTVPVGAWISGKAERLGRLVAAQPGVAELAETGKVEALFRKAEEGRAGFAAWLLLFYALWHRRHIMGLQPAGDVFDTLSAT
jgi:asparagine synthase (glutamine-hydrolysing)